MIEDINEYEEELLREVIEGPIKQKWFEIGRLYEQIKLDKQRDPMWDFKGNFERMGFRFPRRRP